MITGPFSWVRSAVQEPGRLVPEAVRLVLIEGVGGHSTTEITWLGDDNSLVAVVEVTPGHPFDERGGGQQDGGGRALLSGFPARGTSIGRSCSSTAPTERRVARSKWRWMLVMTPPGCSALAVMASAAYFLAMATVKRMVAVFDWA